MRVICFDLDDTLYKEIDYLKSAYLAIAASAVSKYAESKGDMIHLIATAYRRMLETYYKGQNAFEALNLFLNIHQPLDDYLTIYRNHKPTISLSAEVSVTLETLKVHGVKMGLITDGRSIQQRHKIEALGLSRWFEDGDIVISEEFGSEKPCLKNYEYFMNRYSGCDDFTYIGDNLKKDFIAPNRLGWKTVCLRDEGRNIHKQMLELMADEQKPALCIDRLSDILN